MAEYYSVYILALKENLSLVLILKRIYNTHGWLFSDKASKDFETLS